MQIPHFNKYFPSHVKPGLNQYTYLDINFTKMTETNLFFYHIAGMSLWYL